MPQIPLPDLSRDYFSRCNVPFGAFNNTQLAIEGFAAWAFVHVCLDLLTTGTASTLTVRHANSIWICRGSSDGVGGGSAVSAVGVAGTNRWWNAGVFPGLIRGTSSVNHHWMLLENVALGYEMLVNFSQNDAYLTVALAKTGTFSGGNATAFPTPNDSTKVVNLRQTAYNATDGGQATVFGDTGVFGMTRYMHMTFAATGEFICWHTRAGLGGAFSAWAAWKSTGQDGADSENLFVLASSNDTGGRGAWKYSHVTPAVFSASRQPGGAQKTGGGVKCSFSGSDSVMNVGADALTGFFDAEPMNIKEIAPQVVARGQLPDLYMCGTETVGAPIPASGATQRRVVLGDVIIPCIQVQPTF
jgi:hypothetical protein